MIHYSAILPLCYLQWIDKYSYRHRLKHFNMDVQVYVKGKVHIFVKKKKKIILKCSQKKKKNPQTSSWSRSEWSNGAGLNQTSPTVKMKKKIALRAARQALRRNSALISGTGPKANSALSYLYNAYLFSPQVSPPTTPAGWRARVFIGPLRACGDR